jgi:hypothetical protein
MPDSDHPIDELQDNVEKIAAHPWVERFVRLGYIAKGTVYLVIGILIVQALVVGEELEGTDGAFYQILAQPFGELMLLVLGCGLGGYVLWRLIQAFIDPEHSDSLSWKRIVQRIGYATSAFSYASISFTALRLVLELRAAKNDVTVEGVVARTLGTGPGRWLVFLGGLAVISVGIFYLYGAYTAAYISEFRSYEIPRPVEIWAVRIGKFGIAARGIAFVSIGIFIIAAAFLLNSNLAGSLGETLNQLEELPFGDFLLYLIAFGFVAYALYMFFAAWYRRYQIR